MSLRAQVRTYGKSRPTSSSSLIFDFDASSPNALRSSSPPSSSFVITPPPSSPSPLHGDEDEEDEDGDLFPRSLEDVMENEREMIEVKANLKSGERDTSLSSPDTTLQTTTTTPKNPSHATLKGFFTPLPKRKKPLLPATTISTSSANLKSSISVQPTTSKQSGHSKTFLTQTHLTHLPLFTTCQECFMSYMRGSQDESVHQRHHARVVRGILWDGLGSGGKGKGKAAEIGWRVVKDDVSFGYPGKGKGKVVMCEGSWGGSKLEDILSTVDTVLSAPPLPKSILDVCKIFLLITSSPPPDRRGTSKRRRPTINAGTKSPKERVVSVVVAQNIRWALSILPSTTGDTSHTSHAVKADELQAHDEHELEEEGKETQNPNETVQIQSGGSGSVTCLPTPLSTPLGIHRIFTIPTYRSLHLAHTLLDAACENTVYGCTFDPKKGHVAFSQPTQSGRGVMERWGGGGVRVFVDDERQL